MRTAKEQELLIQSVSNNCNSRIEALILLDGSNESFIDKNMFRDIILSGNTDLYWRMDTLARESIMLLLEKSMDKRKTYVLCISADQKDLNKSEWSVNHELDTIDDCIIEACKYLYENQWKFNTVFCISENSSSLFSFTSKDDLLLALWLTLTDVPMNPDTEEMEAEWFIFPIGSERVEIWEWFDVQHSKGIGWIMNEWDEDEWSQINMNYSDKNVVTFIDDTEKMEDFNTMSKDSFLKMYSYLREEEYNATLLLVNNQTARK